MITKFLCPYVFTFIDNLMDINCYASSIPGYSINCSVAVIVQNRLESVLVDYGDCSNQLFNLKGIIFYSSVIYYGLLIYCLL